MTTAALLQATSVIANTVVSAAFQMAGVPGGVFDATPTTTIVATFDSAGVGAPTFITEYRAIAAAVVNAQGSGVPVLVGFTLVTGPVSAALAADGVATLLLVGADAQIPPEPVTPISVRFISGPESGVIPVEIVDEAGPDVVEVRLLAGENNYTPIVVDPTHPMRKKIHFTPE